MESNKRKKIKKIFAYFFGFYFLIFGALFNCQEVMAETNTLPKEEYTPVKQVTSTNPLQFTPQIKIPGTAIDGTVEVGKQVGTKMISTLLPSYIGAFYKYGLTVTGLLATVILMAGGIIWLTSAGNESKVKQAKEMIFGSLAGVLLLFSSYIILETINPELVKLRPIESQSIAKVTLDIVCCQTTTGASMMEADECVEVKGSRMQGYMAIGGTCVKEGCCMLYSDTAKKSLKSCQSSLKEMCNITKNFLDYTAVSWEENSCSKIQVCNNIFIDPCKDTKDGEDCKIGNNDGYCYNQKCYTGPGKDGEPCGNEGGKCTKEFSTILGCTNDNETRDWYGRSCGKDLGCCKPK